MKRILISIFALLAFLCVRAQGGVGRADIPTSTALQFSDEIVVEYVDSLTNVVFKLPKKSVVTRYKGFHKATIELEKSYLKIYSMRDEDGKTYTWDQVNNFDANNKYGKLLRYERLAEKRDGWIRYYASKAKSGKDIVTCVVLVRGRDYAFYMTETAYKEKDLSICKILESASIPEATVKKRTKGMIWFSGIVACLLFFSNLLLFSLLKRLSKGAYIAIAALVIVAFFLCCFLMLDFGAWSSILFSGLAFFSWAITYESESWSVAFDKVMELIGKIGG